jgi:hypothetical protein
MTAISAFIPLALTRVDGDGTKIGRGARSDDLCPCRLKGGSVAEQEELLEAAAAGGKCPLLLKLDLRVREPSPKLLVFSLHVPQPQVALPHSPDTAHPRRHHPLHLGEDPEPDRFQNRYAGLRIDLSRNEQDVTNDDGQQQISRARSGIGEGHEELGGNIHRARVSRSRSSEGD